MTPDEVAVTVYRITGRQLFFRFPQVVCVECDLTVSVVRSAIRQFGDGRVRLVVKPWLSNLFPALLKGAFHPPIVLVEGRVISQGFVPSVEGIKVAIRLAAAAKGLVKKGSLQISTPLPSFEHAMNSFEEHTR